MILKSSLTKILFCSVLRTYLKHSRNKLINKKKVVFIQYNKRVSYGKR